MSKTTALEKEHDTIRYKRAKPIKRGNFYDIVREKGLTQRYIYETLGMSKPGWQWALREIENGGKNVLVDVPERKLFIEMLLNIEDLRRISFDKSKSKVYKNDKRVLRGSQRTFEQQRQHQELTEHNKQLNSRVEEVE